MKSGLLSWPKSTLTNVSKYKDINLKRDTGNAQAADKSDAAKYRAQCTVQTEKGELRNNWWRLF